MSQPRFRFVTPDGRRGRWRRNIIGAVIAACAEAHSSAAVKLSFDGASAAALWPALQAKGWQLERSA